MICLKRRGGRSSKIGEYTVASRIGSGRYGVCFLAHGPTGKTVVLKRFRPRMLRKNRQQNHYEAVILSGLSHPAVPELLGVINCRQGYYYVLEYKEGASLEEWLFKRRKVFSPEEIYRIGSQLFDILGSREFDTDPEKRQAGALLDECELLIIDDLGTELTNSFTVSQLFICLNDRILQKKSTIISTNLSLNEIKSIYSERTFSRISSNYRLLKLAGDDIRIKKKLMK